MRLLCITALVLTMPNRIIASTKYDEQYRNYNIDAKNGAKPPTKNGDTRSLFYHPVLVGGKDTIFSVLNCHN